MRDALPQPFGAGTSFWTMRCPRTAERRCRPLNDFSCWNEGYNGNTTTGTDRRNPDRGASGRTGPVGARVADGINRARDPDPGYHLVRLFPDLTGPRVQVGPIDSTCYASAGRRAG